MSGLIPYTAIAQNLDLNFIKPCFTVPLENQTKIDVLSVVGNVGNDLEAASVT